MVLANKKKTQNTDIFLNGNSNLVIKHGYFNGLFTANL